MYFYGLDESYNWTRSIQMYFTSFFRNDQLKKHLFAHPQSRLTCNICQYPATGQTDLNTHMVR